jgi:transposase
MRRSRLNQSQQERLLEHFVAGSTARTTAVLVGVNKTTASYYFHRLRQLIYQATENTTPLSEEVEVEVDESYFSGGHEVLHGRATAGKIPVFGLLMRGGKVYTKMIGDGKGSTLRAIKEKIVPDSIVCSDTFSSYNVLDVSTFKHYWINHTKLRANFKDHINAVENFWNQAKRYLRRFNGIPKEHFPLFLRECEWRFNNPDPKDQLFQLNQWVKQSLR